MSAALLTGSARFPEPDLQWIEDRFWVWVHYGATKIGRGSSSEPTTSWASSASGARPPVAPASGARPPGVRRLGSARPTSRRRCDRRSPPTAPRSCALSPFARPPTSAARCAHGPWPRIPFVLRKESRGGGPRISQRIMMRTKKPTDLRGMLRYVPQFREKDVRGRRRRRSRRRGQLRQPALDVAVLWSLNIRTKYRPRRRRPDPGPRGGEGRGPLDLEGSGVTDADTLELALTAATRLTREILEGLRATDLREPAPTR
jgi:hypothetical protein